MRCPRPECRPGLGIFSGFHLVFPFDSRGNAHCSEMRIYLRYASNLNINLICDANIFGLTIAIDDRLTNIYANAEKD